MRRRSAFTLIEMLIVIAVISVLAAILMPVLAIAREKSRQTTCISNMRQLGIAASMYAQDFDDTLVPAGMRYAHSPSLCYECGNDPACVKSLYWTTSRAWMDWGPNLLPYMRSEQVFLDPTHREWGCWGYAMNTDSSNEDFPGAPTPPGAFTAAGVPAVALAQVAVPAECLFLYDSHDASLEDAPSTNPLASDGPDTEAWETMNAWLQAAKSGMPVQEAAERVGIHSPWRHNRGMIMQWLDGHVSWKRFTQLSQHHLNIEHEDFDVIE